MFVFVLQSFDENQKQKRWGVRKGQCWVGQIIPKFPSNLNMPHSIPAIRRAGMPQNGVSKGSTILEETLKIYTEKTWRVRKFLLISKNIIPKSIFSFFEGD